MQKYYPPTKHKGMKDEVKKLKLMTLKPPIFATMDHVTQMRYEAQCIESFGFDGIRRTLSDKFLADDLRKRANKIERELFIDSL